ncbi:MAG: hypothetical protein GC162_11010 [Planctomycetes bacterium]|nr:hypothetical protein [Planctomycetota bacterium]
MSSCVDHQSVTLFTEAFAGGDFEKADGLLTEMGKAVPGELLAAAGQVHLHFGRWREAAKLLGRIINPTPTDQLHRTFARNMGAMAEYRPALCERLAGATPEARFQIAATPSGRPTILYTPPVGPPTILSPDNDPLGAVETSLRKLATAFEKGQTIGVYGFGDGYLVAALALKAPQLTLTQQQAVHIIAAEAQHVRLALSMHDYTGPDGPIAQQRFHWWVGEDWAEQMRDAMLTEPQIPFPQMCITHGKQGDLIETQLVKVGEAISAPALAVQSQLDEYYRDLDAGELAAAFSEHPLRTPRALIITSRFTTVLQYAARDTVAALQSLGWSAHLLIEKRDDYQITGSAVQRAVSDLKPDMVFVIDHLRVEYPKVFPANLPWVCWIQDHLSNLTNRAAGASVTKRDFVLTPFAPLYAQRHGYPMRQCIPLGKLTRIPQRPETWASDGDDLAFVSHASQTPPAMVERMLDAAKHDPLGQKLIAAASERMIDLYERGQSLPTPLDVRLLLDETQRETGMFIPDPDTRHFVIDMLFTQLNNLLYRQQALTWFADAADEMGLSLALYGSGWRDHPRFGKYARGPIDYGQPLEEMTRKTKINLQIVPFFCLHQRLLDGLAAGGFFLVRSGPYDTVGPALLAFLADHLPEHVDSVEEARRLIDASQREALEQHLESAAVFAERGDPVGIVQSWRRAGWLKPHQPALPRFDEVSFDAPWCVRSHLARFIHDEGARRAIAEAQRQAVEQRLSYTTGMQRVTRQIGRLIESENR